MRVKVSQHLTTAKVAARHTLLGGSDPFLYLSTYFCQDEELQGEQGCRIVASTAAGKGKTAGKSPGCPHSLGAGVKLGDKLE